nr:hypothetical protein CFP56_00500 [Quercus suber]
MHKQIFDKYRPRTIFGAFATAPDLSGDLGEHERDAVFAWQVSSDDFARLNVETLLQAGVCGNMSNAKRVFDAAQSIGIIDATTGRVNTFKIERGMVHKLAIISVPKQRMLVNLLFFWEEEVVRWQLLCSEAEELQQRLTIPELSAGERRAAEQQLQVVLAKKQVPPSLRDESGRARGEEELPGYHA